MAVVPGGRRREFSPRRAQEASRPFHPALAPIEFADEREPAILGGIQLSAELSDLRFELLERQLRSTGGSPVHGVLLDGWLYIQYHTKITPKNK